MNFNDQEREGLHKAIFNRKSVAPAAFIRKPITRETLQKLLDCGMRAPTHRMTQPWRFKVLQNEKRKDLAQFLVKTYHRITPNHLITQAKELGIIKKCQLSDTILLICMQRDTSKSLPEWEEVAATAMAVQNIHLACTAEGIGGYWSSPKMIKFMDEFIPLQDGEKCLGIFYMGYTDQVFQPTPRESLEQRVIWYS